MVQINWDKNVINFIDELGLKLYKKGYFSYIDTADKYVDYILDEINENIILLKHNETKLQNKKYGKYYVVIKTNKRTAWHVFFDKKGNRYFINKITNNHLPTAKYLNDL